MEEHRDMSNLDERIRALDPFAGATYEHADVASMVERVMTAGPPRGHRRPLAALLAPLTAVTLAGLAIGGALATSGTPAQVVSPLLFGRAAVPPAAISDHAFLNAPLHAVTVNGYGISFAGAQTSTTEAGYTVLYELGSPLPTARPALDAYAAIPPAHPTATLAAAAAHLGVTGAVERLAATTWQLGAPTSLHAVSIAALGRRAAADLYEFRYLRSDLSSPTSGCVIGTRPAAHVDIDALAMSAALTGLLSAAGLHYELAAPNFQTRWTTPARIASPTGCSGTAVLTRRLLVHGVATDLTAQAAFDPAGRLVAASFPVFRIGRAASYPLVSAAMAAGALVQSNHEDTLFKSDNRRRVPYLSHRGFMIVELRSSSVALSAFATTSGALWLLPVYALGGASYTANSVRPTAWSGDVVAAATPLVRIRGTTTNQSRVYGPFLP